jgi:U3 small nucleolar RNA-associated protein 24
MGKTKRTKAIGLKKIMAKTDLRLKENQDKQQKAIAEKSVVRNVLVALHLARRGQSCISLFRRQKHSASLFFAYNTQLGPPYHVLVDTNFINFAIKNKLDMCRAMMDCLLAKGEFRFVSLPLKPIYIPDSTS